MEKYKWLEEIFDCGYIKYNESMKNHTTVRIGGRVSCLVIPTTIEQIKRTIDGAREHNIDYYIIGNGSNLLVSDNDLDILIIKIAHKFGEILVEGNKIKAMSGASMPKVSLVAKQNMLEGMEFACGIPGTVGGGVKMNAGAYGSEFSNIVYEVTYLDENSNICTIKNSDIGFSYRHSIFGDNPKYVILEVVFFLKNGDIEDIENKMNENSSKRKEKQPLEYPNFGSVFKRPEGYFVGKLVQEAGLKEKRIGGAMVSAKHTGFIVNVDNATCEDVVNLIKFIQKTVYEKFNVWLEPEVEFIGGEI